MCRPVDHWIVALLLAWIASAIAAGVLQRRFALRLKDEEPTLWKELGTWHRWNENSELHESAVFWYLLEGLHRSLTREDLVACGGQARKWMLVAIGVFFLYGTLVVISQAGLVPSCYWP
jgi:hypothetical protein